MSSTLQDVCSETEAPVRYVRLTSSASIQHPAKRMEFWTINSSPAWSRKGLLACLASLTSDRQCHQTGADRARAQGLQALAASQAGCSISLPCVLAFCEDPSQVAAQDFALSHSFQCVLIWLAACLLHLLYDVVATLHTKAFAASKVLGAMQLVCT